MHFPHFKLHKDVTKGVHEKQMEQEKPLFDTEFNCRRPIIKF